jgi:lysophospholipase L1-like esterase
MSIKSKLADLFLRKLWTAMRTHIESAVVPGCGGVVFLGDSLTHLGKWDLLFPGVATRNLGIGGERSGHLLERLDSVVAIRPQKLFLLIGTNDLAVGIGIDAIAANVDRLVERLRRELPDCAVYVQGLMPRARSFASRIHALNQRYRDIAGQRGVTFIDLFPAFVDGTGQLRADYTTDDLHLGGAGYLAWREVLKPFVLDPS